MDTAAGDNLIGFDSFQEKKLKTLAEQLSQEELELRIAQMNAEKRFKQEVKELEEYESKKEPSFLIGEPIPWSQITEEDNRREWLWEGYIAKGYTTLLAALWKAGKTTFLRGLFLAMVNEEEFAGQPTKICKVLILSEEPKSEWFEKREDLEDVQINNILIWCKPVKVKPNLRQWIELIEELTKRCTAEGIELVVIDTLTTFWPIDNENDAAQVIKALMPLYSLTENKVAVLLVHHFRKGGGDQAQASRGSGALPGFVDNIIEFTRSENGSIFQRTLKTYGRFDEVIPTVVIEMTPEGIYKTLGDPWQVSKSARLKKIIEIFKDSRTLLSTKEVFNLLSQVGITVTLRSIQNYIKEFLNNKILSLVESRLIGTKQTPFYALTGNYVEQMKIAYPPAMGAFASSLNFSESNIDSLSLDKGQNVRVSHVMKGISVIGETNNNLPEWEEPPIGL